MIARWWLSIPLASLRLFELLAALTMACLGLNSLFMPGVFNSIGMIQPDEGYSWSLYGLSGLPYWEEIIDLLFLVVAWAIAFQHKPKLYAILGCLLLWAQLSQSYYACPGGNQVLACVFLLYACLPEKGSWSARLTKPHLASLLLYLQLAFVYLSSFAHKMHDTYWTSGTELINSLATFMWARTPGTWIGFHTPSIVLSSLTHLTLAAEGFFFFGVLSPWGQPWLRRVALLPVLMFHIVSGSIMLLGWFALMMIASLSIFIDQDIWILILGQPTHVEDEPTPPSAWHDPRTYGCLALMLVILVSIYRDNVRPAYDLGPDPTLEALRQAMPLNESWDMFTSADNAYPAFTKNHALVSATDVYLTQSPTGLINPLTHQPPDWAYLLRHGQSGSSFLRRYSINPSASDRIRLAEYYLRHGLSADTTLDVYQISARLALPTRWDTVASVNAGIPMHIAHIGRYHQGSFILDKEPDKGQDIPTPLP